LHFACHLHQKSRSPFVRGSKRSLNCSTVVFCSCWTWKLPAKQWRLPALHIAAIMHGWKGCDTALILFFRILPFLLVNSSVFLSPIFFYLTISHNCIIVYCFSRQRFEDSLLCKLFDSFLSGFLRFIDKRDQAYFPARFIPSYDDPYIWWASTGFLTGKLMNALF